jgi:hypothetical protein
MVPSAALSCETTEAMPPEKLTPILRIGVGRVLQRQRGGIRYVDDRDLVLRVGRTVGIGQVHRVARRHVRSVEVEAGRRPGHGGPPWSCRTARSPSSRPADPPARSPHGRLVAQLEVGVWPELITLLATMSTLAPFGSLMPGAPTPDFVGSLL